MNMCPSLVELLSVTWDSKIRRRKKRKRKKERKPQR